MTLAEYSIVIQWQLDDRLQFMRTGGGWTDWLIETAPCQGFHFTQFRRKPDSGASETRPATHQWHGGSTDLPSSIGNGGPTDLPSATANGGPTYQAQV